MYTRNHNALYALVLTCLLLTGCAPSAPVLPPVNAVDPTVGATGLNDPIYPNLGNGGYDVTHYDIVLAVDVASNTSTATTTIQAQALQTLVRFNLDFRGLEIDELQVNGQPT
jgi:hypothetical protein